MRTFRAVVKAALLLLVLSSCNAGNRSSPTIPAVGGLSVQIHLPERAISRKPIPIEVAFENVSSKQLCFAFGRLAVTDHGLGSSAGLTVNGPAQGGGGSKKERACLVGAGTILKPGERRLERVELDPVTQAPGEGLLWVSLSVPVFGEACNCNNSEFLEITQNARVQIFAE